MKENVHPEYHPVVFVDGDWELITRSTKTSKKTREIDGVEHYVINVAISANTHPFWTGQQKLVDSAGRLERFNRKYGQHLAAQKKAREKDDAPDAPDDAPEVALQDGSNTSAGDTAPPPQDSALATPGESVDQDDPSR